MWRRLLSRCHPDAGGDHDLFIWADALREHVAGDAIEETPRHTRREPPQHPATGERIDYTAAFERGSFADLTAYALQVAEDLEVYGRLLGLLSDCYEASPADSSAYRAQHQGATYKQVAYLAFLADLSAGERQQFYRIAESIPLSQRHAGHMISRLREEAA